MCFAYLVDPHSLKNIKLVVGFTLYRHRDNLLEDKPYDHRLRKMMKLLHDNIFGLIDYFLEKLM